MKKSSSEQQSRIRKQFDSFCKTLLKNEMIDYERERNYRLKYEISFSTGRFLTVFSRGSIINPVIFKMKYRIKKRTINAARVLDRRAGEELQLWQIRSWCPDFTRGR